MTDFDAAFAGLHARAYRVAYRVVGDRAAAEDVAQEALARAYVSWRRVGEYPEAWVSRVAANLAVDAVRARSRRRGQPRSETVHDAYAEDRVDLRAALRRLPRRQREVVVLRWLADLPEAEVAAALGCSVGSVKTHGSRAMAALRAGLAPVEC